MNQVTLICKTLQPHLGWHGARITFLALFRVKRVNFAQLASAFMGKAQTESNYKLLQRCFGEFELDYFSLAKLVVNLMAIPQPWALSVDRTNWEFGNRSINIWMLGVVQNGVAFPLLLWMRWQKGKFQHDRAHQRC